MKTCSRCKKLRSLKDFGAKFASPDCVRSECKECSRKYSKIYKKKTYENHREEIIATNIAWRESNWDQAMKAAKDRATVRRKTDRCYRLSGNLRTRLNMAIQSHARAGSAVKDLGCSIPELKLYLEARFYLHPKTGEAMTWENRGRYGWHIDHIKPLISFDLTDREQFLQACNYTNLQPLWAEHNLSKGARP